MKKSILLSLALCVGLAFGCTTKSATPSTNSLLLIEGAAQIATSAGVSYAVSQDTNARAYFVLAESVLDVALDNGQLSVTNLQYNLSHISTDALRNPELIQFLPIAISGLSTIEGKNISALISSNAYVAAWLTGTDNGIRTQLGLPTIAIPAALTNTPPIVLPVIPAASTTNK